ncbi:carbohydrate ABC transporter permease [Aquipuribacter hungaricus]|uniref:Carbohydrate ABC transporter permease n=1 Tax=Aquipuribacter hungaricus TaxID=545624 RepID=A0ABV7WJX6_9MICO
MTAVATPAAAGATASVRRPGRGRLGGAGKGRGPKVPLRPSQRRNRRRTVLSALAFLSPWIIGFLVFTAWPIGYSLYLSLTDYDIINAPTFVGLENYVRLAGDPNVQLALGNTVVFTLLQVPLYVTLSFALALLLDKAGRSMGFFRTAFFLPRMTPPVAVGVLVLLLLNGQDGLLNTALGWFGIDGPNWTTDSAWIKPGLVLMSLWTVGGSVLILLAALRGVPRELLDAAKMDGAGFFRRTWHVTMPMVSGPLFFLVVVNTIDGLQTFTEAYTAYFGSTGGYGNDAALFYAIYLFQQAFQFFNMGYASALAWLLFLVVLAITGVQLLVSRRVVYYEADR